MPKTSSRPLVLVLAASLAACAQPPLAPVAAPDRASTGLTAPTEVAPTVEAAAPQALASAPAGDDGVRDADPIVIRGNDRLLAPQRSAAARVQRGPVSSFKFENAPVGEVVNVMLRDLLKVDYVVHPPLNGTVTLTTREAISADRALLLLETALQANGIVMARDARGTYHVGSAEALRGIVSAPAVAQPGKPLPPGYGAVIIPLQYLGAGEMANILRPLVSPEAIVRVDSLRNIIVMRGTRAEAEGWLDLVATFDVNLLRGMSVGVFPLKHTSAANVEAALRMLSGDTGAGAGAGAAGAAQGVGGGGRTAGAARAAPPQARAGGAAAGSAPGAPAAPGGLGEGSPLFGALRVMPIERINAVMVVTPRAAYLDEVRYWIEQFDRPNLNSAEPQLFVYKVQNGSSTHLAELLNGIYGGTQPGAGGATGATGIAPGLTGTTGASANVNNSFASQFGANRNTGLGSTGWGSGFGGGLGGSGMGGSGMGGLGGLGAAAAQPGQPGQQGPNVVTTVLGQSVRVMADRINNTLLVHATPAEYERIEATLKRLDLQRAQVLIEASIVEVTLGDDLKYGLQWAFRNNGISINGNSGYTGTGALSSGLGAASAGSFTYTLANPVNGFSAMLTALANKSQLKVISSPSLMVLDNHTAAIQVGNQQPVNIGSTSINPGVSSGVTTTTSIQYKDTGVMLGVTPSVSAGDLVTLDINQTLTDLDVAANSALRDHPTFLQRQINSKVAVRSGETLVLGGLIKDSSSSGKAGIPLLSALPLVGALFGAHTSNAARTELLVILTPRVLRSDDDARAISRELRDRMTGLMGAASADSPKNRP